VLATQHSAATPNATTLLMLANVTVLGATSIAIFAGFVADCRLRERGSSSQAANGQETLTNGQVRLTIMRMAKTSSLEERRDGVAQLLLRCARLVSDRALSKLSNRADAIPVRGSHESLLAELDAEGTRITELARRLEISKQAVSQSIAELELMDIVEAIPDQADGRARLVRLTDKGRQVIGQGLGALHSVEAEIERAIGKSRFETLREALLAIAGGLEPKAK
jgi:DNA-binding MarR family transcriptional regulator